MDLFSISQLARFSGIKPYNIRIWEKRYNALKPNRSEGNTRYYNNSQLRRLLNIVSLMDSDYKVSELCSMSDKKLFSLINELLKVHASENETTEFLISQLIAAGMTYDEPHFEKIFSHCMIRYGLIESYTKVIYPVLVRIGLMWTGDIIPPTQEHFISNFFRQKMHTAIDSLAPAKTTAGSWLLFLPENEFHEIGLLIANYLIRLSGRKVIYLGGDVPLQSLIGAVKDTNPQNLLLFLVNNDLPGEAKQYLDSLSAAFTNKKIFVAGNQKLIRHIKAGKKIHMLTTLVDLEQQLNGEVD